ncbi:MAG: tetratricopeptide repeat protein [Spirochaetia bacterium]|nr:tetratricopeptide repeat protein [Spirochaetia bacterium]
MRVSKFVAVLSVLLFVFASFSFAAANPAQAKQYMDYGVKYIQAKQFDNAIKYLNQSIKLGATADAYYYLGVAYYYKGNKASALRNFQYAMKLNPSHTQAKAMVSKLGGTSSGAGAAGGPAQQYLITGHKYLKAKQYDMAIKYYQASANAQPTYQAYQFMGTAYYYKGDMANARTAYEKSLQLNPNNPGVRSVLDKIGGGAAGGEQRISEQLGVHPLLLALLFAGLLAVAFLF